MRVAIVGGGIAGLAAAHELLRRGADPIVFEASKRAGGLIGTVREGGWLSEDGPHFLARPMPAMLAAASLADEMLFPSGPRTRWVHLRGRVVRAPSLALLLRAGPARALLEPLFAKPLAEDVSLEQFLLSRLGRRAGRIVAEAMATGVYAGDPARLSARDAFPGLADGSLLRKAMRRGPRRVLWSLPEGLGSLPARAAQSLGGRVRLGAEIAHVEPADRGWRVGEEQFDALILSAPARAAATLTARCAPRLSRALGDFRAAPVAVVHLGFASGDLPRGFGALDLDAALHASGALLPSSMLPGRAPPDHALVSAICGGARHPERAALPDAPLIAAVLGDLSRLFGVRRDPEYARIVRHAHGIAQYEKGHRDRVRAVRELAAELPRLQLAGSSYDGVSVPDAAASGESAAARLMEANSREESR